MRKATTDHWYDVALGTSNTHIAITLVNKESRVGVELYISNDKDLFDNLYSNKETIESEFGAKLRWERLDERKASRIKYYIDGLNFDDHSNYPDLNEKIISTVIKMRKVFKKYL